MVKTQAAEVSAHSGAGIDSLLEKVLLIEAELMELRANPDSTRITVSILETKVDKGKGVVANVLVQKGTLKVGDPFVAGPYYGRVRLMENEHSEKIDACTVLPHTYSAHRILTVFLRQVIVLL